MNWENTELYDAIRDEVFNATHGITEPNLFKFNFMDGIRSDIMLVPVKANNKYGISSVQVWKLIETYQVNEDGSLKQDIK